jgi:hypothetical protein
VRTDPSGQARGGVGARLLEGAGQLVEEPAVGVDLGAERLDEPQRGGALALGHLVALGGLLRRVAERLERDLRDLGLLAGADGVLGVGGEREQRRSSRLPRSVPSGWDASTAVTSWRMMSSSA